MVWYIVIVIVKTICNAHKVNVISDTLYSLQCTRGCVIVMKTLVRIDVM